jgi:hypothetical protein
MAPPDPPNSPFHSPAYLNAGQDLLTWMLMRRRRIAKAFASPYAPGPSTPAPWAPTGAGSSSDAEPEASPAGPPATPDGLVYRGLLNIAAPPSPPVPAFRGLLNLGAPQPAAGFRGLLNLPIAAPQPQASPGFGGLLNLPIAAPDPGLGSFAADEGDYSPPPGLIAQLAALLGHNSAPNPYSPPPPDVLPYAQPSPLLTDLQRAADEESRPTDIAPPAAAQAPDLQEFRGLLSEFGRGLLNVGIGGLKPSPLLPDIQRAADEGYEQTGDAAPDWSRESDTFAGGGGDDPMETTGSDRLRPTPPTAGSPEFVEAVDKSPNIGPNAKRAFTETQRWEGNTPDMRNPDNPALFGITRSTFSSLKKLGKLPGISRQTDVLDLEPSDVPAIYEANANDVLQHVGGNAALEQLPVGVAAALHDVLLRDGVPAGVPMIKDAINAGLETQDKPTIDRNNHVLGRYSFDNLESGIATRDGYNAFLKKLTEVRNKTHPKDTNRNQYFNDLGLDER